jgi:O-antigen ligase
MYFIRDWQQRWQRLKRQGIHLFHDLDSLLDKEVLETGIILVLFAMFMLGYMESLRWPLPGPKATHGILKGLCLLLIPTLYFFRHKLNPPRFRLQNFLMIFFVLAYAVSAALSQAVGASMLNMWYPIISLVMMFALSQVALKKRHFFFLILISIILIFITFCFSFFSIMFRYSVDNIYYFMFLDHRANFLLDEIRKYGKYVSLGPYLLLTPLTFSFLVQKNVTLSKKMLSLFMVILTVLQAVISNNRIDVLVAGIQLVVLLFVMPKRIAVFLLICLVPVVYLGLVTTQKYFGFSLEERLLRPKVERDIETVSMRFTYWETAFYNFRNAPLFGTGPNTYNEVSSFPIRRYWDPGTKEHLAKVDQGIGIHNIFIERLADTGLFGFTTFVIILLYFVRVDILAVLKKKTAEERGVYILFALSSWSWILYGITDNGYGAQGFVTFFFLRGALNYL